MDWPPEPPVEIAAVGIQAVCLGCAASEPMETMETRAACLECVANETGQRQAACLGYAANETAAMAVAARAALVGYTANSQADSVAA